MNNDKPQLSMRFHLPGDEVDALDLPDTCPYEYVPLVARPRKTLVMPVALIGSSEDSDSVTTSGASELNIPLGHDSSDSSVFDTLPQVEPILFERGVTDMYNAEEDFPGNISVGPPLESAFDTVALYVRTSSYELPPIADSVDIAALSHAHVENFFAEDELAATVPEIKSLHLRDTVQIFRFPRLPHFDIGASVKKYRLMIGVALAGAASVAGGMGLFSMLRQISTSTAVAEVSDHPVDDEVAHTARDVGSDIYDLLLFWDAASRMNAGSSPVDEAPVPVVPSVITPVVVQRDVEVAKDILVAQDVAVMPQDIVSTHDVDAVQIPPRVVTPPMPVYPAPIMPVPSRPARVAKVPKEISHPVIHKEIVAKPVVVKPVVAKELSVPKEAVAPAVKVSALVSVLQEAIAELGDFQPHMVKIGTRHGGGQAIVLDASTMVTLEKYVASLDDLKSVKGSSGAKWSESSGVSVGLAFNHGKHLVKIRFTEPILKGEAHVDAAVASKIARLF